ncbi:MAG TPA: hypothetical protein VF676_07650 [Flavobacterium sp.]|jgi:hypothetical protein
MNNFTRKDFIKLTSWGIAATLLPVQQIQALSSILTPKNGNTPEEDFQTAFGLARTAKQHFYNKSYAQAESLYLQCINLAPRAIRFYDGLDNVYCAQRLPLQSVQLFQNGLAQNPNIIAFYDRAARSLMRLEVGSAAIAAAYKIEINSSSLLNDAVSLYQSAIAIDNTKNYLNIGLAKVNAKIAIAPLAPGYKTNRVFKNLKNLNRNTYNAAINSKTDAQLRALIERVDSKPRRELIVLKEITERNINMVLQKKKYYDILQRRETQTATQKFEDAEKLFEIDYKDPNSLRKVKIIYYANNMFFPFIEIRRNFAEASQTFHGYLGLMDTMELAYTKGQAGTEVLAEAIAIGYSLKNNWALSFDDLVNVVIKIAKILLLQSNVGQAKELLEPVMASVKTPSFSVNNKLILFYSRIYLQELNYPMAKNILLIGVKEIDEAAKARLIIETPILDLVNQLSHNKIKDTIKNNISLYYQLFFVYMAMGDTVSASAILSRLLENNPYDSFALNRV